MDIERFQLNVQRAALVMTFKVSDKVGLTLPVVALKHKSTAVYLPRMNVHKTLGSII